jgi:hypothetical protein
MLFAHDTHGSKHLSDLLGPEASHVFCGMRLCAPFLDPLVLLALVVPDSPKCRFIHGLKGLPGTGLRRDGQLASRLILIFSQ